MNTHISFTSYNKACGISYIITTNLEIYNVVKYIIYNFSAWTFANVLSCKCLWNILEYAVLLSFQINDGFGKITEQENYITNVCNNIYQRLRAVPRQMAFHSAISALHWSRKEIAVQGAGDTKAILLIYLPAIWICLGNYLRYMMHKLQMYFTFILCKLSTYISLHVNKKNQKKI